MDPAWNNANRDERARKNIMEAAQIHLVVATPIMTVTFTAGFTLPGGFDSNTDSPNKGMAILLRRTTFHAFVVTDVIAFTSSAVAICTYFTIGESCHPILDGLFSSSIANLRTLRKESGRGLLQRNMLCLSVTMAKALYRAISSIPEEHILSKGKRSNVHHSNGEIGANERRKFEKAKDSQDFGQTIKSKGMDSTLYNAAMRGNIVDDNFLLADHLKRDEENGYQVTPKGNTVLHVAALYGHSHFVGEVLKITPALLCCQNKKNETALHIAANEGHTEVVRVLLACIGDHNTKEKLTRMTDASGDTALHKAVRSQHLDIVKLLVKEDSEFEFLANHAHETPLYLAAESGCHDALITILKSCKKITYAAGPSNRTPLHAAVTQENKDCVRSLWRWNKPLCEEPDLWGWNSLHYAVKLGLDDIVSDMLGWKKSLVYLPAGSENDWTTAIHIAASEGDINMINELLKHCPDCWDMLNSNSQNALHVAILNNQEEVVRFLLNSERCNSFVDEPDSDGNTPLHLLAVSGNHVPELINHPRAKKMSFNKENKTPLDLALLCTVTTKKAAQMHIVVATLIMTVAFTAGFTLPGGFDSNTDSPNKGTAILLRSKAFCAFVVTDTIAFTSSAVAIFTYFAMAASGITETELPVVSRLYRIATHLQLVAMSAAVLAFVTGMYATLAHSVGLAVIVCIIGCISFIMYVWIIIVLGE
ncbi:hypothetical protein BC332_32679 [Capsicum chinense]|nr:hypothetical protein BC332_32679 [Capsicum chinense]